DDALCTEDAANSLRFILPQAAGKVNEHAGAIGRTCPEVNRVAMKVRIDELGVDARLFGHPGYIGSLGHTFATRTFALRCEPFVIVTWHRVGENDSVTDNCNIGHSLPALGDLVELERQPGLRGELVEDRAIVRCLSLAVGE